MLVSGNPLEYGPASLLADPTITPTLCCPPGHHVCPTCALNFAFCGGHEVTIDHVVPDLAQSELMVLTLVKQGKKPACTLVRPDIAAEKAHLAALAGGASMGLRAEWLVNPSRRCVMAVCRDPDSPGTAFCDPSGLAMAMAKAGWDGDEVQITLDRLRAPLSELLKGVVMGTESRIITGVVFGYPLWTSVIRAAAACRP